MRCGKQSLMLNRPIRLQHGTVIYLLSYHPKALREKQSALFSGKNGSDDDYNRHTENCAYQVNRNHYSSSV